MKTQLDITIGQYSDQGAKDRNDDSYGVLIPNEPLLTTKGVAMAIADGMSTSEAAKEASESCVKSFLTDYYDTHESWTVKTSVARILTATNRWLYGQGQTQYLSDRGMVSTFTGLVLKAGTAYVFHVGDTRLALIRGNKLEPLTQEHRTRISRSEDYLSRAFGIDPELEVDYRTKEVQRHDILLFTTDGVHDFISAQETKNIINDNLEDLDNAAKLLCQLAIDHGSKDNVTAQIIRIETIEVGDCESYFKRLQELKFPPDLDPGMVIDGYEIIREIHASNKSQLYLALDKASNKKVVLKTPSVNFDDDKDYIEHFTREVWIGRSLNSPHIVKVLPPKENSQFLYYAMEYVDGETLTSWINRHGTASLSDVQNIIGQVIKGLRSFHRKEMLHQDIKPDNIIIDKNGTAKIIDFGSTRIEGLEELSTLDFHLRGTVDYIAPEYLLDQRATNRSDLYSLGAIAYEMLTGKLPYGKGFADKRSVEKATFISAKHINDDLSYWVCQALAKAVELNPAKRYQTLSSFEMDLRRPNPKFKQDNQMPLLEKNPVEFWRFIALVMLFLNMILLFGLYLN